MILSGKQSHLYFKNGGLLVSFIVQKVETTHTSTDGWTWPIHDGIFFSLEKEGHYDAVTIWMNPEDLVLSEIHQLQKDTYCVIPRMRGTYSRQNHGDRTWSGVFRGPGGRTGS